MWSSQSATAPHRVIGSSPSLIIWSRLLIRMSHTANPPPIPPKNHDSKTLSLDLSSLVSPYPTITQHQANLEQCIMQHQANHEQCMMTVFLYFSALMYICTSLYFATCHTKPALASQCHCTTALHTHTIYVFVVDVVDVTPPHFLRATAPPAHPISSPNALPSRSP